MSEIRLNPITGEWVIIAPERAKRGGNLPGSSARPEIPIFSATCPFCPGNEAMTPEERYCVAGPDGRWTLRSVVNKFSVLSPVGDATPHEAAGSTGGRVQAVGLHEVIVECREHHLTIGLLPHGHVQRVIEAYRQRFLAFCADERIRHVIVFKNHGADAGASQQHPHSQIVGIPIVPGQVLARLSRTRRFFRENGCCLACRLIDEEREQGTRIVAENEHFVAFIPYAALSPYHLWIFPKVHSNCFSDQPVETFPMLAAIVQTVLGKVHGALGDPAFNLVLRSLGPSERDEEHFHWYISIIARVNKVAGFELGTGMYVNPSLPDDCAKTLRDFPIS
jgi:UDPglucose--hexose-1-phosphate uridylyltransferase